MYARLNTQPTAVSRDSVREESIMPTLSQYTSRSSTRAVHGSEHGRRSAERLEILTAGGRMP
jgi:hypothetical protein